MFCISNTYLYFKLQIHPKSANKYKLLQANKIFYCKRTPLGEAVAYPVVIKVD